MVVAPRVPRELIAGQLVAGKYRIERVIASGGQGTVVEATHLHLSQSVAIKFPHVRGDGDELEAFERMFREARASSRLRGPHVARTIDVDVVDGAPFIVMEYLRGVDLKAHVAKHGALAIEDAVGLLLQACEAVAEAHDLGIIHRDLKPSNFFLVDQPDGSMMLKVLDFGLSKASAVDSDVDISDLTEPQRMLGSPRYMSPEQVRDSHEVDARSDIWSMGVILQELLTGAPMFRARTQMQALAMVLTRSPAPVSVLRPDVPAGIERAVLRCLQKLPEHRFADVRELAQALAPYAPPWAMINLARMLPGKGFQPAGAAHVPSGGTAGSVTGRRRVTAPWLLAALGVATLGTIALRVVGRDAPVSGVMTAGQPAAHDAADRGGSRPALVVQPITAGPAPQPPPVPVAATAPPRDDQLAAPAPDARVDAPVSAQQPRIAGGASVVRHKRLRGRRPGAEATARHEPGRVSARAAARPTANVDQMPAPAGTTSLGDDPGPLEGRK